MDSLIHELDNDALLMMYLADELSAEDRADVEQLLGVDGGLRAGLSAVRADGESGVRALEAVDRFDPAGGLTVSAESVAIRRVGRLFRQFQVDHLARSRPVIVPERQPAYPKWAYPIGAVAAAFLVAVGWWGWERHSHNRTLANYSRYGDGRMNNGYGNFGGGGFGGGTMGGMRFVGDAFGMPDTGSTVGLADAEYEASALRRDHDPSDIPALFGDVAED